MTIMKQNVNPSKCGDFAIVFIKGAEYFIYAACKKRLVIGSCALHQYAVFYWDLGLWSAQLCKLFHIPFNGNSLEQNCQCIYDELMMDNFSIQMSNNHWNVINEMFEMFVYYNTIYRYIISI